MRVLAMSAPTRVSDEDLAALAKYAEQNPSGLFSKQIASALRELQHLRQPTPATPLKGPAALAGEWQPIETAPRDGRPVLLNRAGSSLVHTGIYVTAGNTGWWRDAHGYKCEPSSWRPLPPPPPRSADGPPAAPGGFSTEVKP